MPCLHCNEKTKKSESFCCPGCKTAHQIINEQGLGNYYKSRTLDPQKQSLKPDNISQLDLNDFVISLDKNVWELNLVVKGLHCASCIWLIETILNKEQNVLKARINYNTERLKLVWKGSKENVEILVHLVETLGYKLFPFEINEFNNNEYSKKLLKYIAVSGFAAGNIMLLSTALWSSSSLEMGVFTRQLFHFVSALIALPTIIYSGRPFFKSAISALKMRKTNMDVPISLALILASIISLIETFKAGEDAYFDSALMLLFFLLIGRFLDNKVKEKAKSNASELLAVFSGSAKIMQKNKISFIAIRKLKEGMVALVTEGEQIPADGELISDKAEFDTHLITGETLPQSYIKKDLVYAGMINLGQAVKVKITKTSNSSLLNKILEIIEKSELEKSKYVSIAERAASYYTPIVHFLALTTFSIWFFIIGSPFNLALLYATSVLIITCPCALGLAVPTVQTLANSILLKNGIVLKSGKALEKLAKITDIVFDKTGTLTVGKLTLIPKQHNSKNLQLAASMAQNSNHPISKALCNSYKGKLLDLNIIEKPGEGLYSQYKDMDLFLGKANIKSSNISSILEINGTKKETFFFNDSLRSDAKSVISQLQKSYNVELLSGDRKEVVEKTAKFLSIANFYADKMPLNKLSHIEKLTHDGKHVLMVGDGLNDLAAQSTADISISPANALDLSQKNADLIFQGEKLEPIITSLKIATLSLKLIKQNLSLAVIYNLTVLPIAMSGNVTPLLAALAMSGSSIIVTFNSLRLKKWKS